MLNVRSLGFRLAVWYFGTVAAVCALAAAGYWLSIRSELNHALDQGLRYRLMGLREFLEDVEPGGNQEITSRLNEISQLGELYQVFDADGTLIAQSRGLARHGVPQRPPEELGFEIRYGAGGTADFPLRLAWPKVTIGSHTLILGVADPQRKFAGVLGAFTTVLLLSTPLILALATACGLWLGRRALAPVARITDDARAIGESNLSARLAVPDSRDELQQLSETLNDMLERIEQSFTRTRQFTAGASHELRAPMTLIHTAAQYSLRRERTREELADVSLQLETDGLREGERGAAPAAAADPDRQRAQVHAVRRPRDDRRQRKVPGSYTRFQTRIVCIAVGLGASRVLPGGRPSASPRRAGRVWRSSPVW